MANKNKVNETQSGDSASKEKKPFKMPMTWMKEGAPPENPLQHAILGMTWIFVFIVAKFMQAAGYDIWIIIVTQVYHISRGISSKSF